MSTRPAINSVAYLGLGLMGTPMARRLLGAGLHVQVWNRTSSKSAEFIGSGARVAATPAEAACGMDVACLCLADSSAAERVLFGASGIIHADPAPRLLVDFSTIGPNATLDFAHRLREACGTSWVDAPVSGGTRGAEMGELVVFCGGEADEIEQLSPLFESLARRVTRVGPLGTGQTLKLLNQLVVATNLVAIAELINLGRAAGLDVTMIPQALAGGFADSLPLQIFGTRMARGIRHPVLGELALMLKDMTMVEQLAQAQGCELPIMEAALAVYQRAQRAGLAHEDLAALATLYER